jgi:SAM-dependent methyltransferase
MESSRIEILRRCIDKDAIGIEIAPYFNPIVKKSEGYNVIVVDIFDAPTLRKKALTDPNIPNEKINEIEEVDIVSDASRLSKAISERGLEGKISYIVSSHNFEHLPDPIRFLQACSSALTEGGVLTMAIPDCRACFDHFRMPSRLSDWLSAYHREYRQPSPETVFDATSNKSSYKRGDASLVGCDINADDPNYFIANRDLRKSYSKYKKEIGRESGYSDAHCSVLFGDLFELFIEDLRYLKIVELEIIDISETVGLEFFVNLRKPYRSKRKVDNEENFYSRRQTILRKINKSLGWAGFSNFGTTNTENSEYTRRLSEIAKQNEELKARHRALQKTWSWRLTKPLRSLEKRYRVWKTDIS